MSKKAAAIVLALAAICFTFQPVLSQQVQTMTAADLSALGSVTISQGNSLVIDFGAGGVNLTGDFTNYGAVHAMSSVASVTSADFSAANFANQQGAVFSSNLSLNFNVGSFVNNGLIDAAALNVQSANSIINNGTMQAVNNINLMSNIGQIINSGLINSTMGDLNINVSSLVRDTMINNLDGVLRAENGSINVGSADSTLGNINATGGDWIANEVNLIANNGNLDFYVNSVDGLLSTTSGATHAGVYSGDLQLGNSSSSGDPLFFNTAGTISTSTINVGESLAIIGRRAVNINGPITARTAGGIGRDVTIIAGATFVATNGPDSPNPPANPGTSATIDANGTATPSFQTGVAVRGTIDTSGTCAGCAGGNVRLIAYNGTVSAGSIFVDETINAGGGPGGINGDITAIGAGFVIVADPLISNSGLAGTGSVLLSATPPTTSNGLPMSFDSTGAIISGNTFVPNGGPVDRVDLFSSVTAGGPVTINGTLVSVQNTVTGSSVDIQGTTQATFNSVVTSTDGDITVTSPSIVNSSSLIANALNPTINLQTVNPASLVISGIGNIQSISSGAGFATVNINDPLSPAASVQVTQSGITSDDILINGDPGYTASIVLDAVSANAGFDFAPGASNIFLTVGNGDIFLCNCPLDTTRVGESGGDITIRAFTGAVIASGGITTFGDGFGNRGGTVQIEAALGIGSLDIDARGLNGADGGNVSLINTGGPLSNGVSVLGLTGQAISTTSNTLGASSGNITIIADTVSIAAPGGASLVTASSFGTGGDVLVNTLDPAPLVLGGCGCTPNSIFGRINANGDTGGSVTLVATNSGAIQIDSGEGIEANSFAGPAGKINLVSPSLPLNVQNDGTLLAFGGEERGIVGFSSPGAINVTGTGTVAASALSFGNLDPVTLLPPNAINLPVSNPFSHGSNINASFGAVLLADRFIVSALPPTLTAPPTLVAPPTPAPSLVAPVTPFTLNLPGPFGSTILPTDQQQNLVNLREGDTDNPTLQGYLSQIDEAAGILNRGRLILVDDSAQVITTPFGEIHALPGSALFLIETATSVAIYNLHDERSGMAFVADGKRVPIPLGVQILATKSDGTFDQLNPAPMITTRTVTDSTTDGGTKVFAAEFSIASALRWLDPVRNLRKSTVASERAMGEKIMRNAAIMMMLTARNGAYRERRPSQ